MFKNIDAICCISKLNVYVFYYSELYSVCIDNFFGNPKMDRVAVFKR